MLIKVIRENSYKTVTHLVVIIYNFSSKMVLLKNAKSFGLLWQIPDLIPGAEAEAGAGAGTGRGLGLTLGLQSK